MFVVYLLPNHVTDTTTQIRHVSGVLLFSFFLASETMTVQYPLEVGFYHPASGRDSTDGPALCDAHLRSDQSRMWVGKRDVTSGKKKQNKKQAVSGVDFKIKLNIALNGISVDVFPGSCVYIIPLPRGIPSSMQVFFFRKVKNIGHAVLLSVSVCFVLLKIQATHPKTSILLYYYATILIYYYTFLEIHPKIIVSYWRRLREIFEIFKLQTTAMNTFILKYRHAFTRTSRGGFIQLYIAKMLSRCVKRKKKEAKIQEVP